MRNCFVKQNTIYNEYLRNACILPIKMGKYNSLWIDTFKGGESTWKTSIK